MTYELPRGFYAAKRVLRKASPAFADLSFLACLSVMSISELNT